MRLRPLDHKERSRLSRAIHMACCRVSPDGRYKGLPALRHAFASLVVCAAEGCGVAFTDCRFRVAIDPAWLAEDVPVETLAILVTHECLHSVQRHGSRPTSRCPDRDLANVADDLELNGLIMEGCLGLDPSRGPAQGPDRWMLMPCATGDPEHPGFVAPGHGPWKGHPVRATAEQHLALLQQGQSQAERRRERRNDEQGGPQGRPGQPHGQGQGQGRPQGGPGGRGADPAATPWDDAHAGAGDPLWHGASEAGCNEVPVAVEARVREQVAADIARERARSCGDGALDELLSICLENLRPPQVDWRRVLESVASKAVSQAANGRSDYTMARPNRRYLWMDGPVMPGFCSWEPRVSVALDTSGSMGEGEYAAAMAELSGILGSLSSDVGFFCVDTEAKSEPRPVRDWRAALQGLRGGGGTDMGEAVRSALRLPRAKRPDVLVVATDGIFDWEGLAGALADPEAAAVRVVVVYWDKHSDQAEARSRELRLSAVHPHVQVVAARP